MSQLTPYYDDGRVTLYRADVRDAGQLYRPDLDGIGLDGTAAAVVTSPPYNVGLTYDGDVAGDALDWDAYDVLAHDAAGVVARALIDGGRAWSTPRCRSRSRRLAWQVGSGGCCSGTCGRRRWSTPASA